MAPDARNTPEMANSDVDTQGKNDAHRSVVSDALARNLDDLPAVITTAEAARALRVGVREIRELVAAGHLPAARLGPRRMIRIRRDALVALLSGASAPRNPRRLT